MFTSSKKIDITHFQASLCRMVLKTWPFSQKEHSLACSSITNLLKTNLSGDRKQNKCVFIFRRYYEVTQISGLPLEAFRTDELISNEIRHDKLVWWLQNSLGNIDFVFHWCYVFRTLQHWLPMLRHVVSHISKSNSFNLPVIFVSSFEIAQPRDPEYRPHEEGRRQRMIEIHIMHSSPSISDHYIPQVLRRKSKIFYIMWPVTLNMFQPVDDPTLMIPKNSELPIS